MTDAFNRLKAALADRYTVERELGAGGMATVYLAEDVKHHRKVAVKVLRPELAAALGADRFHREIEIAANLTHPHILPLHDSGDADGFLYYVMPHIDGESLRDKLAHEGELPITEAVRILRDVVDALSEAHEKGVVHRDIKPDNVLLTKHHALVTDFGVAKAVSEATGAQKLTTEGVALGTPAYMSPEQAAADPHIDHRADIYAVGVVAYELLTGRPPFLGTTPQMILSAHMTDTPEPVTKYRESVPPALEQLVMKCLEKKAADRWQSAEELLPQLEAMTTPSGGMTPTGTMPIARGSPRRSRRVPLLAVTAIVLLVVFAGLAWLVRAGDRSGDTIGPAVRPLDERPWVIVAAFDGQSDEPGLLEATRAVVMATLDQSELVVAVPDIELQGALRAAGRADATRIDNSLARELAVRNLVTQVVEGRIDHIGPTYSIVLRAVNAEDGTVAATGSRIAETDTDLMVRLTEAVGELLPAFGEDQVGARAATELFTVITPSFEAFKLAGEAVTAYNNGEREARSLFRRALVLDPEFAWVWNRIGDTYFAAGMRDSADLAYSEALARRERLDESTASNVEAKIALNRNDIGTALRIYERMERQGRPWHHNQALSLAYLRRYEEAADLYRRSLARWPQPSTLTLNNLLTPLFRIGEFDEARDVSRLLDSLGHVAAPTRALTFAALDGEWDELERLAEMLRDDPAATTGYRRIGARTVATTRLLRGQARSAREQLEEDREFAERAGSPGGSAVFWSIFASWYTEGQLLPLSEHSPQDTRARGVYLRSLWSATTGDTATAGRELAQLMAHPDADLGLYGDIPAFLEAVIAAQGARWQEVVDLLGPGAARGMDVGRLILSTPRIPRQWLIAEAYRWLGRPDSAAAYFERIAELKGAQTDIRYRASVYPFVHRRLAQVCTELGETSRAADHWTAFLDVFTDPDPELEFMVAEAREALADLARER
jgi:serine/threonine-protein kinase